ncbi:MAG: hypothetical protein M3069_31145 [Chloroflexota bacterium]|nr:hypothetical protein [Chloroflexota bacterium]
MARTGPLPDCPTGATRAAENQLVVWATGPELRLMANGVEVARTVEPTLTSGSFGIFDAGDGNEAVLTRLLVESVEQLATHHGRTVAVR